jgi:hypothetical protein
MADMDPTKVYDAVVDRIWKDRRGNPCAKIDVDDVDGRVFAHFNQLTKHRFAKAINEGTRIKVKLEKPAPPYDQQWDYRASWIDLPTEEQQRLSALLGGSASPTTATTASNPKTQTSAGSLEGISASLKFRTLEVNVHEIFVEVWITVKRGKQPAHGVIVNLSIDGAVQADPFKDSSPNDSGQVYYNVSLPPHPNKSILFTVDVTEGKELRSIPYPYEVSREDDRVEFKKLTADSKKGDADMADKKPQPAIRFRAVKLTDAGLVVRVLAEQGSSPYKGEVLFFLDEEPSTGLAEAINDDGFAEHTFNLAELPKTDSAKVRVQIKGTTVSQESGPIELTAKKPVIDLTKPEVLEVTGRPIGVNQWDLNFGVLGPEDKPLAEVPVRFEYDSHPDTVLKTDQYGEISTVITVDQDTLGSARVNSALNLYNIPLAGKDAVPTLAVPVPVGFWKRTNNWIFLGWTVVLVVLVLGAIVGTLWWTYDWLTTPYQAPSVVSTPQKSADGPWMPQVPSTAPQSPPAIAGDWARWILSWVFSPFFWWPVVLGWAILWLLLIPLCFYDEFLVALDKAWRKTTEGMHKVQFKRKPFRLRAEIKRTPEGQTSIAQFFDGQKIEGNLAELFTKSKKGFKQLSFGQIVRLILSLDVAMELGQLLFKRLLR